MNDTKTPLNEIAAPLLLWYRNQARALPWRDQPSPYRVWISEIMLQQTRVEAVKPYFERFIAALPEIDALAAAPSPVLLKLWEGLGYYSRAANLQKAAREVEARHGGALPADHDALLELPGIGRYTAGAIASIAYGIPVPAVDGNVLRVVARLTADRSDIAKDKTKRAVEARLQAVIPPDAPGAFNQALMELGAMICLPKGSPKCPLCPLRQLCLSHAEGVEAELPYRAPKKARRIEEKTVFLLICDGKIALRKRPPVGLLANMWELPHAAGFLDEAAARAALRLTGDAPLTPLPPVKHVFTHIEWQMRGYAAVAPQPPADPALVWFSADQLAREAAVPAAFRRYGTYIAAYLRGQ